MSRRWCSQASGGEFENGFDVFASKPSIEFHEFVNADTILKVFKYGGDGHPCSAKNPWAAYLSGNAFNGLALGPIEG